MKSHHIWKEEPEQMHINCHYVSFLCIIVPCFTFSPHSAAVKWEKKSIPSKLLLVSIVTGKVCLLAKYQFWIALKLLNCTEMSISKFNTFFTLLIIHGMTFLWFLWSLCVICIHIRWYAWCHHPHLKEIIDFTASHHRHGVVQDFGKWLCQAFGSPIPSGTIQKKTTDVNTLKKHKYRK